MDLAGLMQRIQEGDREAFATLYSRYNKTVYRIAYESTGDSEKALIIVQGVFKEMYQTIREKGMYLGDLYGWLDALTTKHIGLMQRARKENGTQQARPAAKRDMVREEARVDARRPTVGELKAQAPRQYTKEEARALEARADARLFSEKEEQDEPREKSAALSIIGLSLATLLLLWVLLGLLGTLDVLPQWDLGYHWFNETFFRLF